MKILASACLLGGNCINNGGNNRNEKILALLAEHEIIPACPEVLGGLPPPRVPAELQKGVVVNKDGANVDWEFRLGAQKCLEIAQKETPELILLQSRSPSCGVKQRYDGTFSGKLIEGSGVTAELLMQHDFLVMDVEDYL